MEAGCCCFHKSPTANTNSPQWKAESKEWRNWCTRKHTHTYTLTLFNQLWNSMASFTLGGWKTCPFSPGSRAASQSRPCPKYSQSLTRPSPLNSLLLPPSSSPADRPVESDSAEALPVSPQCARGESPLCTFTRACTCDVPVARPQMCKTNLVLGGRIKKNWWQRCENTEEGRGSQWDHGIGANPLSPPWSPPRLISPSLPSARHWATGVNGQLFLF